MYNITWETMTQSRSSWNEGIIWQTSFEFFCQECSYVYCIWLQWIDTPFTTKVCPSFECTVVFCFGSVSPFCWYNCLCIWRNWCCRWNRFKINKANIWSLGQSGCFALVPGSLMYQEGMIICGEIASSMILVNHDCVVQSRTSTIAFLQSSWIFVAFSKWC